MFPKISRRPQSGFGDYIPTFRVAGAERNKAAGGQRERESLIVSFVFTPSAIMGAVARRQEGGGEYFSAAKSNPLPPLELPSPCKRYYDASAMRLFIAPEGSLRIVSVGGLFLLNCFLLV